MALVVGGESDSVDVREVSRRSIGRGSSAVGVNGKDARRVCRPSMNVGDSGVDAGVATLGGDDGPLLGGDGVDARTSPESGLTGVGADGRRGTDDDRVGGVKLGLGDCNKA